MRLRDVREQRRRQHEAVPPTSLFVSAGIGDLLTLSCFLNVPPTIETIYYASRQSAHLQAYLSLLAPTSTKHVTLWHDWRQRYAWYSADEYRRATHDDRCLRSVDWSIARMFPVLRADQFRGLPWIPGHPLSSVHDIELPERYAVLTPFSADKRDARRDLTHAEIAAAVAACRSHDLPVVLLNHGTDPMIEAPGLINLQNRTNLFGSIDITLGASLFIGTCSAMSVIATKVLPASRLLIRSFSDNLRTWKHLYYAPHRWFGFITTDLPQRLKELQWTA